MVALERIETNEQQNIYTYPMYNPRRPLYPCIHHFAFPKHVSIADDINAAIYFDDYYWCEYEFHKWVWTQGETENNFNCNLIWFDYGFIHDYQQKH